MMILKKGAEVKIISGKDKGKSGNITSMITDKDRVIVSGINIVKRHRKATQENPGKIEEIEASIHISNISHIDPDTGKPTRVKYDFKDGIKKRVSVISGSLLDKWFGESRWRQGYKRNIKMK